jgi:RNA polymerase sigma-70 factor (sigma-E family)
MSPSTRSEDDERFHVFVARSTASLTRLAYLLCGDQHLANDLVQTCLVRLYQAWPKVRDKDTADGYARKVLLRCWLNERRRPWRRAESRDGVVPDLAAPASDHVGATHLKEVLRLALDRLPPRQRAAVVLRYWSQHSVTETATILRCSEGTVKSQSARGLAALRTTLDELGAGALEELTP